MNDFLKKYGNLILGIFIIFQPILDVMAGINTHFFQLEFGFHIIIRILFLFCCIFFLCFINKTRYRKISLFYLFFLFIYFILFSFVTIYYKDVSVLFYEAKNLILTFYFPILLVTFFNFFKQYDVKWDLKYFMYAFILYILFISIPNLFHLSFESYTQGKTGSSGWFNSANAVSSIISILLPFIVLKWKNNKLLWFISVFFFHAILSLGTKVPILSLGIVIIMNLIYLFMNLIKKRNYHFIVIISSFLFIFILSFCMIIPKTSFYKNLKIHYEFLEINHFHSIFTDIHYIDRFIFSDRLTFFNNSKENYNQLSNVEKVIGMGYIENYSTDSVHTKMIEIDYLDIFLRHGPIGFLLFFIPVLFIIYHFFKNFKYNFYYLNLLCSILLIFVLGLFSGHIFNVPSVSIFVAIILSLGYFSNTYDFDKYN